MKHIPVAFDISVFRRTISGALPTMLSQKMRDIALLCLCFFGIASLPLLASRTPKNRNIKRYRYIVFFILSIISSSWAAESWAAGTLSPAQKMKQLETEMQKLSQTLAGERKQQAKAQEELRQQELKMAKVNKKIQELDKAIALHQEELKEQQAKEQKFNKEVKERQEHLAESIRALHATGQQPDLKLLLNQDNTLEFQRLLRYYQYFNQALQQQIGELDEDLGQLTQLREKIEVSQNELAEEREQQQEQRKQLELQQKERSQLLAKLTQSINNTDKELAERKASQKELEQVIAASEQSSFIASGPFAKQQGKLPWPVQGKVQYSFGSSRSGGKQKYDGMVISAKQGQAIYAIYQGRIVYADWLRGYGLLVIIDHGNRYMSLYAHNEALFAKVGDTVKAGQQIGAVGTTGGLRQPALYFEIRHNGKPINPQPWLRKG